MPAEYVRYIRSLIGPRPVILVGTSVAIRDGAGRVLFQRRSDNGLWSLPGGMVEMGESVEDAARREVREEVGLEVRELHLVTVLSGEKFHYVYPNGDEVWNVTVLFRAAPSGPVSVAQDAETLDAAWLAPPFDEVQLSPPTLEMRSAILASQTPAHGL